MSKRYDAMSPVEYQDKQSGQTKTKWVKCGSAFQNDSGVFTVWLEALPLNGKLVLKEPKPYTPRGGGGQGNPQSGYGNQGGGRQQNSQDGGGQGAAQQTGFDPDDGRF